MSLLNLKFSFVSLVKQALSEIAQKNDLIQG